MGYSLEVLTLSKKSPDFSFHLFLFPLPLCSLLPPQYVLDEVILSSGLRLAVKGFREELCHILKMLSLQFVSELIPGCHRSTKTSFEVSLVFAEINLMTL